MVTVTVAVTVTDGIDICVISFCRLIYCARYMKRNRDVSRRKQQVTDYVSVMDSVRSVWSVQLTEVTLVALTESTMCVVCVCVG